VDKVALEVGLLRGLLYSPVTSITPIVHTHLQLHDALTWRTNGRIFWIFKEKAVSETGGWEVGESWGSIV